MAGVLTHFAGDLITADYFRGFLQREPARALRLLTTKESGMQDGATSRSSRPSSARSWATYPFGRG